MVTIDPQIHRHRSRNPTNQPDQLLLKSRHEALRNLIRQIQHIRLDEVPRNCCTQGMKCQLEAPHVDHTMIRWRFFTPEAGFDPQSDRLEEVVQIAGGRRGGDDAREGLEILGLQLKIAECCRGG